MIIDIKRSIDQSPVLNSSLDDLVTILHGGREGAPQFIKIIQSGLSKLIATLQFLKEN